MKDEKIETLNIENKDDKEISPIQSTNVETANPAINVENKVDTPVTNTEIPATSSFESVENKTVSPPIEQPVTEAKQKGKFKIKIDKSNRLLVFLLILVAIFIIALPIIYSALTTK